MLRCVHEVAAEGPVVDLQRFASIVAEGGSKLRDGYERIMSELQLLFCPIQNDVGRGDKELCARGLRLVVRQMLHFSIMALIAVHGHHRLLNGHVRIYKYNMNTLRRYSVA